MVSSNYDERISGLLPSLQASLPLIIDIAGDAMIATNKEQQIVLFNRAAELTFGYSVGEIIGRSLDVLLPERFTNVHHSHIEHFIKAPIAAKYMHNRSKIYCLRADGNEFPAEASISKLDNGEETLLLVILRDITEREKAEAELRATVTRQKEINDLKSRFISIVSHELRTPLAIIQSSNELLEHYGDKMPLDRKQECFQQITDQVRHLSDLIEDTLMVTKNDTVGMRFDPQIDDLERFCYSVVNKFELTNDRNHQLVFTAQGAANAISFDKKLLWQALTNLISNAIKYSPDGGRIDVGLICSPDDHIYIQVKDNGIGIPEKDQKQIFENFHRASNVGTIPGTGLGLVIARQSVVAHGGELTFESREGIGTTFSISIPPVS